MRSTNASIYAGQARTNCGAGINGASEQPLRGCHRVIQGLVRAETCGAPAVAVAEPADCTGATIAAAAW